MGAIAYCLLMVNNAFSHDFSPNGTLTVQSGINDKYRLRTAFTGTSSLLYSHDINDYITLGSYLNLSATLINNNLDHLDHLKYTLFDVKSKASSAYVFLKSPKFGNIQIGLTDPVTKSMRISSEDTSVASGGINSKWLQYTSVKPKLIFCSDKGSHDYTKVEGVDSCIKAMTMDKIKEGKQPPHETLQAQQERYSKGYPGNLYELKKEGDIGYEATTYGFFTQDTILAVPELYSVLYKSSNVPIVTYYSPKFKGFEVGFSYIPKLGDGKTYDYAIAGGVKYQNNILSDFDYAISGVVEYVPVNSDKFDDILSYSTGISINYKNVTFAGSYNNLGKLPKEQFQIYPNTYNSPEIYGILSSEFYDLGVKFTDINNGYSIGVTYFYSNKDVIVKPNFTEEQIKLLEELKKSLTYVPYVKETEQKQTPQDRRENALKAIGQAVKQAESGIKEVRDKNKQQVNHSLSVYALSVQKTIYNSKLNIYADFVYFNLDKPLIPHGTFSGHVILVGTKYSF